MRLQLFEIFLLVRPLLLHLQIYQLVHALPESKTQN